MPLKRIDRSLVVLAILLQLVILTRLGGLVGTANAYDQEPPALSWIPFDNFDKDAWKKVLEWVKDTGSWNKDVARRLAAAEQRLAALENAKPAAKKAAPKR